MRLKDKVAIITGGGSGMGEAVSRLFGKEGAKVVIGDINEQLSKDIASQISNSGNDAMAIKLDVVDENQVKNMVDLVINKYKRIDILINCVGKAHFGPSEDLTIEEWNNIININLTGPFLCCREVGKVMKKQKSGKIVNFGSTGGLSGVPYMAHYTAAKHGIVGLTKALAVEWGKYNINVNCICPGATQTAMLLQSTTEEYRKERIKRIPLKRLGFPEDQANVALFLSSPESDYVSGAHICVDGGIYAMSPATGTDVLEEKS